MKYYKNTLVVRTFLTTVSIMGIDSQGINQGKCSCGECLEFVRGSGVLCGYCECITRKWQIQILALQTLHKMGKLPNQEITSGMMSHLDGSQIQKPIIPAFPIPFWQNSTSDFGRHVHSKTTSVWNLSRKESGSGILKKWSREPTTQSRM